MDEKIAGWAFIAGVLLAILGGLLVGFGVAEAGWMMLVLVIIGLIVGFLNMKDTEITAFLIAAIALMVLCTGNLQELDSILEPLGTVLALIVGHIQAFVAPAALIVALAEVYRLGDKEKVLKKIKK